MKTREWAAVVAAVLISGCGGASVETSTLKSDYPAGGCVGVVVTNRSSVNRLYVDHCFAPLERLEGETWTRLDRAESEDACLLFMMSLSPGGAAGFFERLPPGLAPGTYRLVPQLSWSVGNRETVEFPTESFTVQGQVADQACSVETFGLKDAELF